MDEYPFDKEILIKIVNTKMPFGKYKGTIIVDLPQFYLAWFAQKGFPKDKLGQMLALTLEIKSNGLTGLLTPLRKNIH
ncbi:MAG: DUF3820 family protein [Cyclobacteriaceae bacterium]